jgi:hypothetical protein
VPHRGIGRGGERVPPLRAAILELDAVFDLGGVEGLPPIVADCLSQHSKPILKATTTTILWRQSVEFALDPEVLRPLAGHVAAALIQPVGVDETIGGIGRLGNDCLEKSGLVTHSHLPPAAEHLSHRHEPHGDWPSL